MNHNFVFCHSEYICYDDGCHLKKYAINPSRRDLTLTTQKIAEVSIIVDKMHMAGHVDAWCKQNCDPRNVRELDKVRKYTCIHDLSLYIIKFINNL